MKKHLKFIAIIAAGLILIGTFVSIGHSSGSATRVTSLSSSSGSSSSSPTSTVIQDQRKISLIADVLSAGGLDLHVFNGETEVQPVYVDLEHSESISALYSFEVIPGYTTIQFTAEEAKAEEESKTFDETKASDDPRSAYGYWITVVSQDSTIYTSENIREPFTFTIPSYASTVYVEGLAG